MMIINNLKKAFKGPALEVQVLKGINLSITQGETLALLGRSGSGKSTLLSIMGGLDFPDEGEVKIHNVSLGKLSDKELVKFRSKNIGIIFQQFHLVSSLTALENILLPLNLQKFPDAFELASKLLSDVGLADRAHHLPSQLSGGESQRVAIARALAAGPSLLLADEPSGNLDEETGEKVMDLLFKMVKEKKITLVLVTHDKDIAARCDRVVYLEHGCIQ
jgi:putative ABC transport system ATP-binding protein